MRARYFHAYEAGMPFRIAPFDLALQMSPLVFDLPPCDRQADRGPQASNPGGVEAIPAPCRFLMDAAQVHRDGPTRQSVPPKALKLRVTRVALRLALQHRLREKRFSPERDEAFCIQVRRVQAPEAHYRRAGTGAACNDT